MESQGKHRIGNHIAGKAGLGMAGPGAARQPHGDLGSCL